LRTIICKKCGAPIDASLGECPICGAVYYILPQEENGDETRVWNDTAEKIHSAIDKEDREPEELAEEPTRILPTPVPEVKAAPASPLPRREPRQPAAKAHSPSGKKPLSRTWIFAVIAAALLAVLTLVLCFMTGVFDFSAGGAEMPDVMGLNRDVAVNQLKAVGLTPNIVYAESQEEQDIVIGQSPDAGKTVGKGTGVTLTVSSGAAATPSPDVSYVEVPDVMGLSYDAAAAKLQSLGLSAVRGGEEYSETAGIDEVTRQSPLSGARVEPGSSVRLTVSKGAQEKEFSVVLTAGKGGSISPSGAVTVKEGESLTITVTPDEGYVLTELRIDGQSVGADTEYVIESVDKDYSVYAVFAAAPSTDEPAGPDASPEVTATPIPGTPSDITVE
jgi:hypothetical protein